VSSLDRARDAIDLVAAAVDAPGLVEDAIFGEDLVDGRAPTRGVVFTEDVVKIAHQQGRYKSDPVFLDTVWTTMTAAKEAGHEGQGAKADHDSWQ